MADVKYLLQNFVLPSSISDPSYTIDTTSVGEVKGCIISSTNPTVGSIVNDRGMSIGFWDTNNAICIGVNALNSALPIKSSSAYRTNKILCVPTNNPSGYIAEYSISSTSSGITITMDTMTAYAGFQANIMVFGGADIELDVGSFNLPASGSTTIVNSLSHKPNAIWFASIGESGVGIYNDAILSMGVACEQDNYIAQNSISFCYENGVNPQVPKAYLESSGVIDIIASGGLLYSSNISSFDTNGFSVYTPYGNPNNALVTYISFYTPKTDIKLTYANSRYWGAAGSVEPNYNYQDTNFLTKLFLTFGLGSGFASGGGTMAYNTLYNQFRFSVGACLYTFPNIDTKYNIYYGNALSTNITQYVYSALVNYNNSPLAVINIWHNTYNGSVTRSNNQLRQGNGRYFILCFQDKKQAIQVGNKFLVIR